MAPRTLTQRDLNRALLARQMLFQRTAIKPIEAIERLAGLQAQVPNPPYIGLWTRLATFERDDLTQLMQDGKVVRAAMMRSTLHLVTADDHRRLRAVLQPALDRALRSFYGKGTRSLDIDKLVAAARPFLAEAPRTTGELKARLLEIEPAADGDAMAYAVRNNLPLVQVPPSGTWRSGTPSYTLAEAVVGPVAPPDLGYILRRYLAAFGPASVMDFQFWTGLTRMKKAVEAYRDELRVFRDESGTELFDLPDAPLPDPDTPAPPLFMPEYDNLIISHKDRTRVISNESYSKVFLSAGRVSATILIDGFVAGVWKIKRNKADAVLNITPFVALTSNQQQALTEEGERLLRFIEDDAAVFDVRFT